MQELLLLVSMYVNNRHNHADTKVLSNFLESVLSVSFSHNFELMRSLCFDAHILEYIFLKTARNPIESSPRLKKKQMQGVEKGCNGNKWLNEFIVLEFLDYKGSFLFECYFYWLLAVFRNG